MTTNIKVATVSFLFLFSCQNTPKQTDNSSIAVDSFNNNLDTITKLGQTLVADTSSNVFVAMLKPGLDNVKAIINDSTMFVATKGQLLLYWNNPHTAFIADGRFGYISPEQLLRVDTPCFKFNFSKRQLRHEKDYELYQSAQNAGADLNSLIKRIQQKDNKALLQFFRLSDVVDGASAEEFSNDFWLLINLWTDKELSSFISTLEKSDKKAFCELLIESSYSNPYEYYKLYYPLTLQQINLTK
jgi:hypothetical protein